MLWSSAKGVRYESDVVIIDVNVICRRPTCNLTESRLKVISKYIYIIKLLLYKIDSLERFIQTTWVLYGQAKRAISTG